MIRAESSNYPRTSLLAFERVSFAFAHADGAVIQIVSSADFSVGASEIVSIVGESGVGKTTVLRLLSGQLLPDSGNVRSTPALSFLTQDDLLVSFRTVWENACLALELRNELSDQRLRDCVEILQTVHLTDFLDFAPSELSGGMRRRVAFVRQIVPRAGGLLLDEPFAAQDGQTKRILEDITFNKCREFLLPCLIVTHDLDTAVAISDRVIHLSDGGTMNETWRCPPETARLRPSLRRQSGEFAEMVAGLSRSIWEPDHE